MHVADRAFGALPLGPPIIVVRLSHDEDLVQYRALQAHTERRVRRSILALLALTTTVHAQSVIFTYDQWERLSTGLQEIYLAGAIDSFSTITVPPRGCHRQILQRLSSEKTNNSTHYC
jgi:hypothetical protein